MAGENIGMELLLEMKKAMDEMMVQLAETRKELNEMKKTSTGETSGKEEVQENNMAKEQTMAAHQEEEGLEVYLVDPDKAKNSAVENEVDKEGWKKGFEKEMKSMFYNEMRNLKGMDRVSPIDLDNFGVPGHFHIPKGFKMPEFDKFDGRGDPDRHIVSYLTKMSIWSRDEDFLTGLFHESLTGPAFSWYMDLEPSQKKKWTELTHLFQEEYCFNLQARSTRRDLGLMKKGNAEAFKDYAQRWRAEASQVVPKLTSHELIEIFMETLPNEFVQAMMGNSYPSFAALIEAGTSLEQILRTRNFGRNEEKPTMSSKKTFPKREVNNLQASNPNTSQPIHISQQPPRPTAQTQRPAPQNNPNFRNTRPRNFVKDERAWPDMAFSKQELLDVLVAQNRIYKAQPPQIPNPIPKWFQENETCAFHSDGKGHSLERCYTFRKLVLDMIDDGRIVLSQPPNVQTNPLPRHGNQANMVEVEKCTGAGPEEWKVSMREVWKALKKAGLWNVSSREEKKEEGFCLFCQESCGHKVDQCGRFKEELVHLMALRRIRWVQASNEISMTSREDFVPLRIPLKTTQPLEIPLIRQETYESNCAVPWNYGNRDQEDPSQKRPSVEGITRAGRVYSPPPLTIPTEKGKEAEKELRGEVMKGKKKENEELEGFLQISGKSDYSIVEQLKKTASRISLFELLQSSDVHRQALYDLLKESYVQPELTSPDMVAMVDPIRHLNSLTFYNSDIVPGPPRALHITVTVKEQPIAHVLIDGGSALNVCPLYILKEVGFSEKDIEKDTMMVRAFDGSASRTVGRIVIDVDFGPNVFPVSFEVMNIVPTYSMLLGRPWINQAQAVPSTLHQMLKYIKGNSVITIMNEEEIIVVGAVLPEEKAITHEHHHSLEIIEEPEVGMIGEFGSSTSWGMMKRQGYEPGQGLGTNQQGPSQSVSLPKIEGRRGLGYEEPTVEKVKKMSLVNEKMLAGGACPSVVFVPAKEKVNLEDTKGEVPAGMGVFQAVVLARKGGQQRRMMQRWTVETRPNVTSK